VIECAGQQVLELTEPIVCVSDVLISEIKRMIKSSEIMK
jgi:hypothetical protein